MPELPLDHGWQEKSTLSSVQLPDGSESGGVLIDNGDGLMLVLFADEELSVGDRVVIARGLELAVAGVERGTLSGRRVTALDVRESLTPGH